MILALGARGTEFKAWLTPPFVIPGPVAKMEEPINENPIDELLASPVKKVQEDHISPCRPLSSEAETGGMFEVTLEEVRKNLGT